MTKKHVLLAVSALVFLLVTFFISSGVEKNTAQAAVGDIIASYDFEDGRVPDPGGVGFQTQIPAAILTDPDGNHFLRMTASPSDAGINGGPPFYTFGNTVRSELDVGVFDWWTYNPVTVSFSMRILSATPPFSDGTMLAQFFQYGNNSGWVAALAGGPNFMAFTAKDGDQYELRPSLDAVNLPPDQWVNVSMTVFFSANVGGGQISVSVNGQNVGSFSARTLKNTNDPMHFILDFYGDPVFPYGTVDFDNIVLSSGSTAPPLPSTSSCHILDSSQAVPTGFGASYNVLSSAQELLLKANCTDTSVSYPVGNGSQTQYIYNQGYYWTGTAWSPFTFSCNNLISSAWCVGNANFTRNMTATELANTNYYVAYVCNWDGSSWHCGCRDSACTTNYWQLQMFKK